MTEQITETVATQTVAQMAQEYVPKATQNISDLPEFNVDAMVFTDGKGKSNKTGEEFTYNYIKVDEVSYRMPDSVLKQLKVQLANNPKLKKAKVVREGTTRENTEYTVVPL